MGESASMANRTVFPDEDAVLISVSDDIVVCLVDEDTVLFEGFFLAVLVLNVFFRTPRSRSYCILMCKVAKEREVSICSCILQSLYFLVSIKR
jgi:hypothetical protein